MTNHSTALAIPPHSVEAERAVLGSVLRDPEAWPAVRDLTADDFYRSDHRAIFSAISDGAEEGGPVDAITVGARLEDAGQLADCGGLEYLADLARDVATPQNASAYVAIVRNHALRRRFIAVARDMHAAAFNGDSPETLAARAIESLGELANGHGADDLPDLLDMAEVLAMPDDALEFVVDALLAVGGVSLLVAFAKAGKTTLAAVLTLAVARGGRFLGRECRQGPVLFLGFEDHPVAFRDRLVALGASPSDPILSMTGYLPASLDACAWLRRLVDKHRPSLVVADTLIRLVRVRDLNDYAVVSPMLEPFYGVARETGAHLMLLHHARKDAGEFGLDVLGSQALPGGVDTVLSIKRDPDSRARYIQSENRYGTAFEPTVLQHDSATGHVCLGVRREDERFASIEDAILDYVSGATSPVLQSDIIGAQTVSGRGKDIREAIKRCARNGRLVLSEGARRGTFRYAVPHATGAQ